MFRHTVIWRMDADDTAGRAAHARRVIELMRPLVDVVPSIRGMHLHENTMLPEENADLMLTVEFDDRAGFEEYRRHPAHVAHVDEIRALYRTRLAIDHVD